MELIMQWIILKTPLCFCKSVTHLVIPATTKLLMSFLVPSVLETRVSSIMSLCNRFCARVEGTLHNQVTFP